MKELLAGLWTRGSRVGLKEGETVVDYREVILLNRLVMITPIIILLYIPFEIYFNGFSMMPVVLLMLVLFMVPMLLHKFRLFTLARYFIFIIGSTMITHAGLMVGKGINNHVSLIPVALVGIVLFKKNSQRIIAFFITLAFFVYQQVLFSIIPPVVFIPAETKEIFSLIFFLVAITLSFLVGFYFISINREYEKIVVSQKESIASKNKEITDSITYARRIQQAILPSESSIKDVWPDSFVLYKPKDIVAGDFYWLEKTGSKVVFAVADSTGHGVPGAMVSVICHNALGRSVREFGLDQPAEILDKTREIVVHEFAKSTDEVTDGMDISLLVYDSASGILHWAGAYNPVILMQKGNFIELKADKQPVGKFSSTVPFTNHRIDVNPGDSVYLFTDGFQDQFGGSAGKKLKYKGFKSLLLQNQNSSMQEQQEKLEEFLSSWQGDLEQVDDICVAGIRF